MRRLDPANALEAVAKTIEAQKTAETLNRALLSMNYFLDTALTNVARDTKERAVNALSLLSSGAIDQEECCKH